MANQYETAPKLDIISLIGCIGAGKTTKINDLRKCGNIVIEEDLNFWNSINMLEKTYNDQKRYSFTFQTMVLFSNLQDIKNCEKQYGGKTVYTERSIIDSRYVFVEVLREIGCINDDEYKLFCWQYDLFSKHLNSIIPKKFMYIRTNPKLCFDRIKKRGNKYEKNITIDYLQRLYNKYEDLVARLKKEGCEIEIIDNNFNHNQ